MTQTEEIKEMKSLIDSLRIQVTGMAAKQKAMATTILNIIPHLNPEVTSRIYSDYVNRLEYNTSTALNDIEDKLYQKPNGQLIAQRFEIFSGIQNMKNDPAYRQY